MPLTENGIYYADANAPASTHDIMAAMATSVDANLRLVQVVESSQSSTVSTSSADTYVQANLSASITPKSLNSKILVMINCKASSNTSANSTGGDYILKRNNETIYSLRKYLKNVTKTELFIGYYGGLYMNYIDEPATLAKITYSLWGRHSSVSGGYGTLTMNSGKSTITLLEIE